MVRALIALVMGLTVMMPGIPMTTSQWLGRVSSMGANTDSEQSKVHEIKRDTGITQTLVEYEPTVRPAVNDTTMENRVIPVEDTKQWSEWGTCLWSVEDGVLHIRPKSGDSGELGSTYGSMRGAPWYGRNVTRIESQGSIILNQNSSYLFYGQRSLASLSALADWDVSRVTNMSSLFSDCSSLSDLSGLADWDVSQVTDMGYLFFNCKSLSDLTALKDWNVSNVTSMGRMFYSCSNLTDLTDLKNWSVSNVEEMRDMFYGCSSLTDLSAIKNWNVLNVNSMDSMFWDCSSIQRIGIPSIANGGMKLVENADRSGIADALPRIISEEDESMRSYTWDDLNTEMTTNPERFESGTVWVKEAE